MINYTERLTLLMQDIVARVPTLSFIDIGSVLVFARSGRSSAEGAFATCHSLSLPPSDPGYYFWRDRASGRITHDPHRSWVHTMDLLCHLMREDLQREAATFAELEKFAEDRGAHITPLRILDILVWMALEDG